MSLSVEEMAARMRRLQAGAVLPPRPAPSNRFAWAMLGSGFGVFGGALLFWVLR